MGSKHSEVLSRGVAASPIGKRQSISLSHFPIWFSIQVAGGDVRDDILVSTCVLHSPPLDGPFLGR